MKKYGALNWKYLIIEKGAILFRLGNKNIKAVIKTLDEKILIREKNLEFTLDWNKRGSY